MSLLSLTLILITPAIICGLPVRNIKQTIQTLSYIDQNDYTITYLLSINSLFIPSSNYFFKFPARLCQFLFLPDLCGLSRLLRQLWPVQPLRPLLWGQNVRKYKIICKLIFLTPSPVAPVHSASTVRMGLQAVRKLVIVERINLLVGNVLTTVVERK